MNEIAKTEIAVNESPGEQQKDQIQQQFDEIKEKITTNPDAINRLNKNTLETVNTYLYANKDKATEMLLNISEAMTNTKLENKDRKSLMELETICLKRTNWENVGTYQLNRDVLNTTFDISTLTSYGKFFDKGNTTSWFGNITETYTPGANQRFDELFTTGKFKNVHFTPAQLQKELYNRNTERTNQLVTDMQALTIEDIQQLMATAKITDIADIRNNSSQDIATAIKKTFPNITDAYRELNYLLTKDPSIMAAWTTKISAAETEKKNIEETKNIEEKKIQDNVDALLTTFTKDDILVKYLENNKNTKDNIYAFNSKNPQSKLGEIVTTLTAALKKNPADAKVNELITLLKEGQLKKFQAKIYEGKPSRYNEKWNDGKLGEETLGMVNTYLSPVDNDASVTVTNVAASVTDVENTDPVANDVVPLATNVTAAVAEVDAVNAAVENTDPAANEVVPLATDVTAAVAAAETVSTPNIITKIEKIDASKILTFGDKFQGTLTDKNIVQSYYSGYQKEFNLIVDTYNGLKQDIFKNKDTKDLDTFLINLLQEKNNQIISLEAVAKGSLKMDFTGGEYPTPDDTLRQRISTAILSEAERQQLLTSQETGDYKIKKMKETLSNI